MRLLAVVISLSALCATCLAAAEELPPIANGSLKLGSVELRIVDGIAFTEGDVTWIALSSSTLDRKAMKEDRRLDNSDVMRHPGNTAVLEVGAEGAGICVGLNVHEGESLTSDSVCNEEFATAIGVQKLEDGRMAGASTWKGEGGEHVTFTFSLPVEN